MTESSALGATSERAGYSIIEQRNRYSKRVSHETRPLPHDEDRATGVPGPAGQRSAHPIGHFVGLATLDIIHRVEHVPGSDEKVTALGTTLAAGGPATNAAVVFAGLGGRATLTASVGADAAGELVLGDLDREQVRIDRAACVTEGARTSVATIAVTASIGERAIISAGDGAHSPAPSTRPPGLARYARVVLADSYETHLSIPLLTEANALGIPTILDIGRRKQNSLDLLELTTLAIVSRDFDRARSTAAIFAQIHACGTPYVVITDGDKPIEYSISLPTVRRTGTVPTTRVENVVDTLGAGDFFHGSAAHFVAANGLSPASFERLLAYAGRITALSVQSFGTRTWLRDLHMAAARGH
ncbi:PfkB family carbohydrate kinase [Rarobacter incanus]|uniref:PfkB family carbohydrate kinase n=1 Tax=Rarobacter incanus TaxID=153494 RepID=UPI0014768B5E|nr:PfkB family carbohydrate kinase [Rarobacter incanus]